MRHPREAPEVVCVKESLGLCVRESVSRSLLQVCLHMYLLASFHMCMSLLTYILAKMRVCTALSKHLKLCV